MNLADGAARTAPSTSMTPTDVPEHVLAAARRILQREARRVLLAAAPAENEATHQPGTEAVGRSAEETADARGVSVGV